MLKEQVWIFKQLFVLMVDCVLSDSRGLKHGVCDVGRGLLRAALQSVKNRGDVFDRGSKTAVVHRAVREHQR